MEPVNLCVSISTVNIRPPFCGTIRTNCSAFVTLVVTNEAGVLRAAASLIIVAGAQVQHDKWSSGEGILSFPMIFQAQTRTASIHSFAKVPALKSPCHSDVLLISQEPCLACMRIVEGIQTSAQRLRFSMLARPAQSAGLKPSCQFDKLLQRYCWKVRNQKYLKKQKWVLLRTLSNFKYSKAPSWATLYSFMHVCSL